MIDESTIWETDQIRQTCSENLAGVQVSDHFRAILCCLLEKDWTTPRLVEMVITPDDKTLAKLLQTIARYEEANHE